MGFRVLEKKEKQPASRVQVPAHVTTLSQPRREKPNRTTSFPAACYKIHSEKPFHQSAIDIKLDR